MNSTTTDARVGQFTQKNLSEADVIDQFCRAMREQDIHVSPADIVADGKLHRIRADGDRDKTIWFVLHADDRPAGMFGCNRRYGHDQKFTWKADTKRTPLTAAEKRAYRERMARLEAERAAQVAADRAAAADRANRLWNEAAECDTHAYLERKVIRAHGLRVGRWEVVDQDTGEVRTVTNQALLIPMRDLKKRIHSLQAIMPQKREGASDKWYLTDGDKEGHFWTIGRPLEHAGKMVIIICEGYATGASIHEATGHCVIIAFDAPNLLPVAKVWRARFPDAIIIIAADNDQWTLKPVKNPGVTRAREAAAAVGALVAIPPFDPSLGATNDKGGRAHGPTDFNDLQQLEGAEAVRGVFDNTLSEPADHEALMDARPSQIALVPTYDEALSAAHARECLARLADAVAAKGRTSSARLSSELRRELFVPYDGDLERAAELARAVFPSAALAILAAPGDENEAQRVAALHGATVSLPLADGAWRGWGEYFLDLLFTRIDAKANVDPAAREFAEQAIEQARARDDGEAGPACNGYFTILGYDRSDYFIYTHGKKQVLRRTRRDFDEIGLLEFAPMNWWEANFGGDKQGAINRKAAAEFIIRTSEKRGIYDPSKVRGRGAWIDDARIVYHHGSHLTVEGQQEDVTAIKSRFVYELAKALPNLGDEIATDEEARWVIETAKKFRWERPASALLAAGFAALAPICGALEWRPHVWLTGGPGCGKSSVLVKFLAPLVGGADSGEQGACVLAQGSSSEAGVRQRLGMDSLPVLFDEAEPNSEREAARIQNVLSMIRQASTESDFQTLKGTASGEAMSFHIRSMFALASIQTAIKQQADIERLTVLRLRDKRDTQAGDIGWTELETELSRVFGNGARARRLINRSLQLAQTTRRNIRTFVAAAARKFGTQREGDQYGTLLAGAWSLMSSDLATAEEASSLIDSLEWSDHVEQDEDDRFEALNTLLSCVVRTEFGDATLLELLQRAKGEQVDGMASITTPEAERILGRYGLGLGSECLYVANKSVVRDTLMDKTKFHADLRGQLLRVPGAERGCPARHFPGLGTSRCIKIPMNAALSADTESF